jgi:hypothetical protein
MRTVSGAMVGMKQRTLAVLAISLVLAGCAGSASSPAGPGESPAPSPATSPAGPVTTEAEAVAAVVAQEPRLTGITAKDPDMIGQSSFYEVTPASGVGAFVVNVTVGWGDCPAGCMAEHTWSYAVAPDGTVTVLKETGGPVPPEAWPAAI